MNMDDDNLADWIPPELVERARVAAERDALTAERLARPKQKRRKREGLGAPEPRNPRFAFVVAGLCAAFLLAGRAAGLLAGRSAGGLGDEGFAVALFDWASSLFTLLLYLRFMLPVRKEAHRLALGVLLGCRLASDAAFAAATALAGPERSRVPTLFLAALMSSPLILLLYGLLRRRSTEKAAGILQLLLVVTVLPIALYNAFTAQNVMKLLQAGCMVFLLINWPVLAMPASWEKAADLEGER